MTRQHSINITMQWIPGHTGTIKNEKADKLAKAGTLMEQPISPVSFSCVKQIINQTANNTWLEKWSTGSTARTYYTHMPIPDRYDTINDLNRHQQTNIFRLRTFHTTLSFHLNRIKQNHPSNCRHCTSIAETTEHILLHCPALASHRKQLLPTPPTLSNRLYGTTQQLRQTSRFFDLAIGKEVNVSLMGINKERKTVRNAFHSSCLYRI